MKHKTDSRVRSGSCRLALHAAAWARTHSPQGSNRVFVHSPHFGPPVESNNATHPAHSSAGSWAELPTQVSATAFGRSTSTHNIQVATQQVRSSCMLFGLRRSPTLGRWWFFQKPRSAGFVCFMCVCVPALSSRGCRCLCHLHIVLIVYREPCIAEGLRETRP